LPDATPSDPLQDALLTSLLSGQSNGGGLDLHSLLAAQGDGSGEPTDDRLALVLRWLEQRRAAEAQSASPEDAPSEAEIELHRLEELRQRRELEEEQHELKRVTDALYAELEMLRARNDVLAAALGACFLCFGDDLVCPECGGRGTPGSLIPDEPTFRQYVAPAVRAVRATHTQTAGGAAPPADRGGAADFWTTPNPGPRAFHTSSKEPFS